eukprot:1194355-Prorocentrum_minimum.AAC.2
MDFFNAFDPTTGGWLLRAPSLYVHRRLTESVPLPSQTLSDQKEQFEVALKEEQFASREEFDEWDRRYQLRRLSSPSAEWRAPCRRPQIFEGRIEFSSGGAPKQGLNGCPEPLFYSVSVEPYRRGGAQLHAFDLPNQSRNF